MKIINILPVAVRNQFELENNIAGQYANFYQNKNFNSEAWVLSICRFDNKKDLVFRAFGSHPNRAFSLNMLLKCVVSVKCLFHIHGYNSLQARAVLLLLLVFQRCVIVNYHGAYFLKDDMESKSIVKRFYARLLMWQKKRITFLCINDAQEKFHAQQNCRSVFLPMPINDIFLKGDLEDIYSKQRTYDAAYVGRISKEKGFDELLSVFLSFAVDSHRFALVVVCDIDQEIELRELLSSVGNIDLYFNASAMGVREVLLCTKVICLNSPSEGLPRILLECLSVGCNFLAVRNCGTETIFNKFNHGTLVERINHRNLKYSIDQYSMPNLLSVRETLLSFQRLSFLKNLTKVAMEQRLR
tara:strand:- start:1504 stop:2571 length:1068 start_codon:yes stop_codon:yes gene_type:complete